MDRPGLYASVLARRGLCRSRGSSRRTAPTDRFGVLDGHGPMLESGAIGQGSSRRPPGVVASMGKLEAIWVKRAKRGPMDSAPGGVLDARGLQGNANRGGKRAVTIIEREVFERVRGELGAGVDPVMRRANLMISGIPLAGSRGRVLEVGTCRILINGETRPCERMDEALDGLRKALEPSWGGGAFGVVLEGGEITVGDRVRWAPAEEADEGLLFRHITATLTP